MGRSSLLMYHYIVSSDFLASSFSSSAERADHSCCAESEKPVGIEPVRSAELNLPPAHQVEDLAQHRLAQWVSRRWFLKPCGGAFGPTPARSPMVPSMDGSRLNLLLFLAPAENDSAE